MCSTEWYLETASHRFQLCGAEIAINAGYNKIAFVPERHHEVPLFWDALLSIGHAHSFPRPKPDYYSLWISNFTAPEFQMDLTASSTVNVPTISARLRLVVIRIASVSSLAQVGKRPPPKNEHWRQTFLPMPQVRKKGCTNQQPARRVGAN
jgi:hypothetical protein